MIEVALDKSADQATVTSENGRAVIDVQSESGIGGLTATLQEGEWPETIVVRLHLRGLESLEIGYDDLVISTGVSSTTNPGPALMLTVTDEEGRTQAASPSADIYYPDIRIVGASEATPAFPLKDGAFEISLPAHFHQSNYPSFTVKWIDFYR